MDGSKLEGFLRRKGTDDYVGASSWFDTHGLQVYLRSNLRIIHDIRVRCIDIANATARNPGNGDFTRFLEYLESTGHHIYVENVLEPRFAMFFIRRGYEVIYDYPGSTCLFRRGDNP